MSEKISFWQHVREDATVIFKNDPAIKSKIELFFCYPGLFSLINYRIANKLYNRGFRLLARFIMAINQFITNIDIHPACSIGRRVFIDHCIGIVIGETAIIEDDVLIYQGVTIGGVSLKKGKRHPTIKKSVVIGAGAKILGNITIGENAKIGANSVVVKDVEANATAVGIPAKSVSQNSSDDKLDHDQIPDITKKLIEELSNRVAILEDSISKNIKH